ncbi:hypothetical protein CC86DRAFT_463498 [Ophiobolus disseminans]|uniref:Uncharacterized protein n=1 Tax=Ophiobolus disseminans TaxID=1469910 RepID=A0A6A7AG58_9PLEO|nr:hypothetical protein CC86DRAFT_463498 [Ophiobolus disseminans]
MANEEQRRAFASYMGTAGTSAGQQVPQYSGGYASSGNPYLFQQQFPGVQGLPTAPTPPPAAPSSVASYPSYTSGFQGRFQGGYQNVYPQSGLQQGSYQQNGLPQRPPPLGQSEAFPSQQSQHQQPAQPGHLQGSRNYSNQPLPPQASRNYSNQPLPLQGYNAGWQYTNPMARQNGQPNGDTAPKGAMVPSRNFAGDIVRSSHEQFHFHQYEQAPPQEAPAPPQDQTVPVLLCHTCSVCNQMRSAGYHRHNPVVPGKPLVLTPCRKCKKKIKSQRRSMSSFTRVRSCTADVPCDWPSEDVQIDIEYAEHRGRARSRDVVYVYMRSPSRPHVVRQSSSQTRLGLRVLQQDPKSPYESRTTRVRVSSLSPRRASRYGELHPVPDVVRPKQPKQDDQRPPPTNPNHISTGEPWPIPDGIHAHLHRKAEMNAPRRPSSRIEELDHSPPTHTRTTRVEYRTESVERRRNVSPARVSFREEKRDDGAEARMRAHPQAFRAVCPEQRNFRADESTTVEQLYRGRTHRQNSPGRGILKSPAREETPRRRHMRDSQQSTAVEVGGAKVHWGSHRKEEQPAPDDRGRQRPADDAPRFGDDFELYHNFTRRRYVDDPEPAPPVEEFERVRIRRRSPSPGQFREDIRIDRARNISPPPQRPAQDVRIHNTTPQPHRERERVVRPPPSPERPAHMTFRHVSRDRFVARARSVTPPPARKPASDDMTDSESAHSGELLETRTFRDFDENGKPAIFVEERRRVRMLEQGSETGGRKEFRMLNERAPQMQKSWREV